VRASVELFLASSNPGKLREFASLASQEELSTPVKLELLPGFDSLPSFEENAPTFGENAAGKALHYSRLREGVVFADDSGLVVPALGGAPGVHSARYAGPNASNEQKIAKLLAEIQGKKEGERSAYFVCVTALACRGRILAVISDLVQGEILHSPRGSAGFGYDPVFYFPPLKKSFADCGGKKSAQPSREGVPAAAGGHRLRVIVLPS